MKAVLVVDMPTMCSECKLHYKDLVDSCWIPAGCIALGKAYDNGNKIQEWCPLKPMPKKEIAPERKIGGMTMNYLELAEARGRNKVINELLGETE